MTATTPPSAKDKTVTSSTAHKTQSRPVRKTSTKVASSAPTPKKEPAKAPTKTPVKAASTVAPEVAKAPKKTTKSTPAAKEKKLKVVRDSYTIPKTEYTQLGDLKKRALGLGVAAKKSELLRAGLLLLAKQADAQFKTSLAQVPTIKTGRPAKS